MRSFRMLARTVVCAVVLLHVLSQLTGSAAAQSCGDLITGHVTLTRNLLCDGEHGLRLSPGAVLDCNTRVIAHVSSTEPLDRYGIYFDGADDAEAKDCVVEGFEVGIRVTDAAGAIVRGVVTRKNKRYGIEITQGSREALIVGTTVAGNGDEGIHVSGSAQPTEHWIAGNTVTGNGLTGNGGEGIYLLHTHGNTVLGNTVRDNDKAGIYVKASDDNRIEGNILVRNPLQLVFDARRNLVIGNTIRDAPSSALLVTGDDNTIRENGISGAEFAGIRVAADAAADPGTDGQPGRRNMLVCNQVTDNPIGALFDAAATPNTVNDNEIAGNAVFGIDASAVEPSDPPIDATRNWWGCPGGPGTLGCDGFAGNVDVSMPVAVAPSDRDDDGSGDGCDSCTDSDGDGFADPGFPASTCDIDNCPEEPNAPQSDDAPQSDADEDDVGDACDPCTDTDGDGFADPGFPASTCGVDNCPEKPNADQADADRDGLGDACDPCPDTDRDGFADPGSPAPTCRLDNCPNNPNPDQGDADGDGVGDACDRCTDIDGDGAGDPGFTASTCPLDNCPAMPNADQADADGDAFGDGCDPCTDIDGDGRGVGAPGFPISLCPSDNCLDDPNPNQADADRDGRGDVCDSCTDTDGDGRGDPGFPASLCPLDLCPADPSAGQADTDGDGVGDACDRCTDSDGDGSADPGFPGTICPIDNCPAVKNPNQSDLDGDGTGDRCDSCDDRADADRDRTGDSCDSCTDTDGDERGDPGFPASTCPADNCPSVKNPGQEDADVDGLGDLCDPCTDRDGDGVGDPGFADSSCGLDNCPLIPNAEQLDVEENGTGDICECRAAAPGRCIAGGGSKRDDCLVEINSVGPAPLNPQGTRTKGLLRCRDGDPECDRDAAADGRCTFGLIVCFGNDDPRLPQCRSVEMESFEVRRPQADRAATPDDRNNAVRLEGAASSTTTVSDPGLAIRRRGKLLTDEIAVPAGLNRCTRLVDVIVPPPSRDRRPVSRKLKLIGWSVDGREDADKLVLKCDAAS